MRRVTCLLTACSLLLMGSILSGCGEAEDWRQAEMTDSAEAYRAFLETYPESTYAAEAIKRIEEQDYVRASELGSSLAYGDYLSKHPEGSNSDAARINHARTLFEEGKEEGSVEKMTDYVEKYPEGASHMDARHYKRVFEYAQNIEMAEISSKKINLQGNPEGELDGWGIYAKVTNNGDKNLTTCQIRIEWLSEFDVVLLKKLDYVATPQLDMWPTPEWMQVPMKPGETRNLEYIFGRQIKPDHWEGKVRLMIHDLRFEGEKDEVAKELK